MTSLSIAQYIKNKNIRLSLAFNKATRLYYYKGEWIDEKKLDEVLPIDQIPEIKGRNNRSGKRFIK